MQIPLRYLTLDIDRAKLYSTYLNLLTTFGHSTSLPDRTIYKAIKAKKGTWYKHKNLFMTTGILSVDDTGTMHIHPMDELLHVVVLGDHITYERLLAVSLEMMVHDRQEASMKIACRKMFVNVKSKESRNANLLKMIKALAQEDYQGDIFSYEIGREAGLSQTGVSKFLKRLQGFIDITHQKSKKANKLEFHTGLILTPNLYVDYLKQCVKGLAKYETYFFSHVGSNNQYSTTYKDFRKWIWTFKEDYELIGQFRNTVTTESGQFVYQEEYNQYEKHNRVTGRTGKTEQYTFIKAADKFLELTVRNKLIMTTETEFYGTWRTVKTAKLTSGQLKSITRRLNKSVQKGHV